MSAAIPAEARAARAAGCKLLIGVSGGVDSVALLHALVQAGRRPVVLHFDHRWRAESRRRCEMDRRPRGKTRPEIYRSGKCPARKKRTEAAARAARYAFFAKTARRLENSRSGPGAPRGRSGRNLPAPASARHWRGRSGHGPDYGPRRFDLHRPWLGVWRKEIVAYARREKLSWREDATNRDPRYRRNFIRLRLLPYLRKKTVTPAVAENLWRAGRDRTGGKRVARCAVRGGNGGRGIAGGETLRRVSVARQRRTILRWLQTRGDWRTVGFADVEAGARPPRRGVPAKVNLPGGKHARRRAGKIFIE